MVDFVQHHAALDTGECLLSHCTLKIKRLHVDLQRPSDKRVSLRLRQASLRRCPPQIRRAHNSWINEDVFGRREVQRAEDIVDRNTLADAHLWGCQASCQAQHFRYAWHAVRGCACAAGKASGDPNL